MVKYVKTEQGYVDASIFAPAQFKPEGKSYLTFSSPNNFTLEVNNRTKNWDGILEYFAYDKTWTVWDGTTILSGHNNDDEYVLYLRGTGNTKITGIGTNKNWIITGTDIKCIGNIENLLDYATVEAGNHPTMTTSCYSYMFKNCTALTQAPDLPATTLANNCYESMFYGCTSLTKAPALLATTLANSCYQLMFEGCTALTQAPDLPATTLVHWCYRNMFYGCTALTQAPALPATTLAHSCYQLMFYGCTALTQAPALPATTLADYCYSSMFSGCSSLTQAPELPATSLANNCYESMFSGCTALKLSSTKTVEYAQEYRIPTTGTGTTATDALTNMFVSTGGTFTGTPAINTTYYLSTDNMIVRDTEVATLNGYVGSMIDNSVSNPLNITGATVGQIAKITAVDESGKPTSWEAADIYDKPASGIPKSDLEQSVQTSLNKADAAISLGLTAATPGQIIKVKTVQDGKPTEWEAVDMPSEGVEWYEVIDMETTENVNDLIVSTDKNGRPISGYHALAMVLCFMIPADSTQTSNTGKIWVYPMTINYLSSGLRIILDDASWKTIARSYSYLYAGSNRAMFVSGAPMAGVFNETINVFDGIRLHIHADGDHLPAGTKVRCLVLSKGWMA